MTLSEQTQPISSAASGEQHEHTRPEGRIGGSRERGTSLVEYALLIALIALVLFSAVGTLGGTVNSGLTNANDVIAASAASAG